MNRFLLNISLLLAMMAVIPETLFAEEKGDLAVWMVKSPCARARQTQPLLVNIYNYGNAASGAYTVGLKVDGVLVGETHIDEGIDLWGERDVVIEGNVTLEYGKTYEVEAYVETDEPDTNPQNNIARSSFTMPAEPEPNYPYTWDDATCRQDFTYDEGWWMAWNYDTSMKAFYISERASNWYGTLTTVKPITFKEGDVVTCSFEYGTSGAPVKLTLAEKCTYHSEPVAEKVLAEVAELHLQAAGRHLRVWHT